ncbi:hypothetical protein BJV78DRAFT_103139 [Lactifluus subvellereus]|nr:hypothetical protein BJV78DRAFT_103139 [Lactifluus subvellereus]
MAAFEITADDSSPLILYSPACAWTDSPSNDSSAPLYSQQTWHTTSAQGASATIRFNGTGIWFFGANRPDYGTYNISIDGYSVPGNAQSQNASFQQLLGGQSGLVNGPHTAVLTNTGLGTAIDLDSIVFDTQIGNADATITSTTIDDSSPDITYLPTPGDWAPENLQGCFNNTLHLTQTGGAQAQFTVNGDAVAIYGTVSPEQADYTVTVDGHTRAFRGGFNGLASSLQVGALLYFTNGLASGPHNLTLTANPQQRGQQNTGKFMDIDKIVVFNASNVIAPNDHSGCVKPSPIAALQSNQTQKYLAWAQDRNKSHSSKRLNAVTIGVLIAGIVMLLLLITLAIVLIRIRRRRPQRDDQHPKWHIWLPATPKLPMQAPLSAGISPWTPLVSKQANPCSDAGILEKGPGYPLPTGPNQNPFLDDARLRLPPVPVLSVVRGRGKSGDLQPPSVPVRPSRPATLDLPVP